MSAAGVFTRLKRVEFVEKNSGEVGDGTAWPLLVTPDQLAEIAYRVKDMRVADGGSATYTVTVEAEELVYSFVGDDYTPSDSALCSDDFLRGYYASLPDSETFVVPASHADYFGEEYSIDTPFETMRVWNISDNERGMWLPELDAGGGFSFPAFTVAGRLATGLSFTSYQAAKWAFEFPGSGGSGGAGLYFLPQVAFVDTTGSGNPLDPGNELYMGCGFSAGPFDGSTDFGLSSFPAEPPYIGVGTIDLDIVLSDSTVTMVIYCHAIAEPDGSFSGSPIEIRATKWWPFAKPGGPAWNSATGEKL